jgi:hypothetical protein
MSVFPTSLPGAGGAIVSTADDVARFAAALFGGDVVGEDSLFTMIDFDTVRGLPGTNECMADALGVARGTSLGRETWGHVAEAKGTP